MNKVSGDINKNTQVCTATQENTGKLIENAVSQAPTKPQDIISPNPSRTSGANQESNSSYAANWTTSWQTNNSGIQQHPNYKAYHLHRPYETPVSPHVYIGQQPPNLSLFDFNQSLVKLIQCQTELTHRTQDLP